MEVKIAGGHANSTASLDGELPAGNNNIGDVDVASLPGTVATDITAIKTAVETLDNAISGSEMQVDVVTLPALPAGTNNIGDVDVASLPGTVETDLAAIKTAVELLDNTVSGSELQVDVVSAALPTGAATEATLDAIKTAVETLDNAVAGSELQVDIVSSALPTGAATETTLDAIRDKIASSLVPEVYDYIALTYVAAGDGAGEIETVTYKTGGSGGTTVATLTLAYNGDDKLASVTRS